VGADQALLRVSDSIAYVAAARHVYAVVDDLVWHPQHVEITANEAMQAAGGSSVAQEAKEFLREKLESGPKKAEYLIEEAGQEGIGVRTLKRIKKELGIRSRREGGSSGTWFWELPTTAKGANDDI